MQEKACSKCNIIKSIDQFRRLYDGYRSECKECYKVYINQNKEAIKKKKAEYYRKRKEKKKNNSIVVDWQEKYNASIEENRKLREALHDLQNKSGAENK